jgi:hypothetical protein
VSAEALALHFSFDDGNATDQSGNDNHGGVGARPIRGRFGRGMAFRIPVPAGGRGPALAGEGDFFQGWSRDFPIHARAMVLADSTLFVAGPEDTIDEEEAYKAPHDPAVQALLARQDEIMRGEHGALLIAVSSRDGSELGRLELDAPPVWDGMAAVQGRLLLTTTDGQVLCFGGTR